MNLLKELEKKIPASAKISEVKFEGSNIVLYTKNKEFFKNCEPLIKEIVREIKKRVEVRADMSIIMDMEKAKKEIMKIVPDKDVIKAIYFEPELGKVVIEATKPGVIIGRGGETYKQIKDTTFWLPKIERAPAIDSEVVRAVRNLLHTEIDYRKKFLNKTGQEVSSKFLTEEQRVGEWVRVSFLGGAKSVGMSSLLVQSKHANILMDCGIDPGTNRLPHLEAPEFNMDKLDCIVVSHAHNDHIGAIPLLYDQGYKGPLYCSIDYNEPVMVKINGMIKNLTMGEIADQLIEKSNFVDRIPENDFVSARIKENIEVPAFSFKDYKISFRPLKAVIRHKITDDLFELKTKTGRSIKVTGSHSVFTIRNGSVEEVKVNELKVGDYIVVPHRLPSQEINELDISAFSDKGKLPKKIPMTRELMRILGYFTAEGNFEGRGLRFTFGLKDERFVRDLSNCMKYVFGINTKEVVVKGNVIRVSANSKALKMLFSKTFFRGYSRAINKRVPDIVFNVSNNLKFEFLRSYFACNGYVNHTNKTINIITVSKGLSTDLSYLCTQMGFNYTLFERIIPSTKTKKMVYKITINFSDFFREMSVRKGWQSCGMIPIYKTGFGKDWYYHRLKDRFHVSKERLLEIISKNQIRLKSGNLMQIHETLLKLANSDLSFLPIISIKKIKPTSKFVYDFSVDNDENFVGGHAPVCLHNTAPTRDLLVLMCLDYIDVAHKEGNQLYYTKKAIEKTIKHTIALEYGEVTDIAADTRLTLQPSGHLLGSSLIHLHIGEGLHNIVYTGDFKFGPTRLFEPAFSNFQRVETLIMESTYGGRENIMPTRREVEEKLMVIINRTMERGGKVIIPSFAVGRGQEVMCILAANNFSYPVYIDGMIWDATAIHTTYPEYLSEYLQKSIFHYGKNPFISEIFHRVTPKERDSIIDSGEPCVVISTSGMMNGGPVMEYFKALAPDKKNTLIFVGYQGIGTIGRKIQKGFRDIPVMVEGKTKVIRTKMEIETIDGLSGHSERRQLMSYIRSLTGRPGRIIINHGEKKKCLELARDIHTMYRIETDVPSNLDAIRLV